MMPQKNDPQLERVFPDILAASCWPNLESTPTCPFLSPSLSLSSSQLA